jgi:hypothetical protein
MSSAGFMLTPLAGRSGYAIVAVDNVRVNTVKGIRGIHPRSGLTEQSQILFNINSEVKVVRMTYCWTPVICHTTSDRVQIPFSLEILAVVVDGGQEEMVKKREMARVLAVKTVELRRVKNARC